MVTENLDATIDGIIPNFWVKFSCTDNEGTRLLFPSLLLFTTQFLGIELNGKSFRIRELMEENINGAVFHRRFKV
jgi:hypothetical protein